MVNRCAYPNHYLISNLAINEHYIDVPNFGFKESITLKNINFRYLNTKKDALSHINLTINQSLLLSFGLCRIYTDFFYKSLFLGEK